MDNFIKVVSKTMYCFIWNKKLSYFSKLHYLLRSRSPVFVPNTQHCNWYVAHQKGSSLPSTNHDLSQQCRALAEPLIISSDNT